MFVFTGINFNSKIKINQCQLRIDNPKRGFYFWNRGRQWNASIFFFVHTEEIVLELLRYSNQRAVKYR